MLLLTTSRLDLQSSLLTEETDTQFSGKAGIGVPVSDASEYGEMSFLTAEDEDDFGLGGKLGVKYNF